MMTISMYTSSDIGVGCDALIVNDYMITDLFSATVAAGKKANEVMYLLSSELRAAGIENVGQIEIYMHTFEADSYSGKLTIVRKNKLYEMDFPTYEQQEIPVTEEMESAFGVRPVKAILGPDLVCIFEYEEQIRNMKPDQSKLAGLPGRGQNVTAKGKDTDCVSRSFFPKLLVPEDPVCGSAHCQIADYWSKELGKTEIHAYQASKRGGHLYCELLENGRIKISGETTLVAISDIVVDY